MTSTNPPNKDVASIPKGTRPSEEHEFYLEWGKESLKETISNLNDTFKLFITLDTVLLSAYLGFFEKISGHLPPLSLLKILPGVFVIASLVASIIGIFPVSVFVNLSAPEDIKRYKEDRTNFKSKYLKIAAITLICGFIVLFIASVVSSDTVNTILQPTLMPTP